MEDELTKGEKNMAGFLLILFTVLPAFLLIGLWPDRMPDPKYPDQVTYQLKLFHVQLQKDSTGRSIDTTLAGEIRTITAADTAAGKTEDTLQPGQLKKTPGSPQTKEPAVNNPNQRPNAINPRCLININTILLLLVALAGFLGNMIHVATSFTTYVGAEQFKKSWILWYYVKPFSASALAVGLYFVFRAGFLTMNNDPASINLYGVMTLSLLAGLFTDKATLKLKEIFEVVFRSKEERPDTLEPKPKINTITPLIISAGIENILTLAGENLDTRLKATINDENVAVTDKTKESAILRYKIPESQKDKKVFIVIVKDADNNILIKENLKLKTDTDGANGGADNGGNVQGPVPATVTPLEIEAGKVNLLSITGESLTGKKLTATINGEDVAVSDVAANTATINYTIPESQKDATEFVLSVKDEAGTALLNQALTLKA